MQLCKVQLANGQVRIGAVSEGHVRFLDLEDYVGMQSLSDILFSDDPATVAHSLLDDSSRNVALRDVTVLPPVDRQEIWAAGVTYKRSQEARERESVGAAFRLVEQPRHLGCDFGKVLPDRLLEIDPEKR